METESTQATADRIGRTQSAVSHALNRLREMLNDPLFVRHGPRLIPTALLNELRVPLAQLLNNTDLLMQRGHQFHAESSDRTFVIGCMDLAVPLALKICDTLQNAAPKMRFRTTSHFYGNQRLRDGEIDLIISLYRNTTEPGLEVRQVGLVDWAYFATGKVKPQKNPPDMKDWLKHPHVQVHTGKNGRSPIDDALRITGEQRHVGLQVDGVMQALYVASNGDYLFTSFPKLVGSIADKLGLNTYDLPFDVPAAPVAIITRETKFDPLARWAMQIAAQTARQHLES